MEWGSFVAGAILAGIVTTLVFTQTGREVTGRVGRATGERLAYHIEPKR